MAKDDLSDDYVANLLKAEAKKSTDNYAMVGLSAMLAKRPTTHAPKPNVRFLRNILRETDSHNSALLTKEAEESRHRLRRLRADQERNPARQSDRKRRSDRDDDDESGRLLKRRRSDDDERHESGTRRKRENDTGNSARRHRSRPADKLDRRRRHRSPDQSDSAADHRRRQRRSSQSPDARDFNHVHQNRSHSSRTLRAGRSSERLSGRSSHKQRSTNRSRTESGSNSDQNQGSSKSSQKHDRADRRRRKSPSPSSRGGSDSDPLEQFVGPLPPRSKPPVRKSGRGTFSGAETLLDQHFAADYDASTDVRPLSEDEDDWEQALEVMRDRQRWKQQGADRLRQAGFTDEQVRKWEKGDEKTESDVKWAKKGEGREWDRGKFVDDSGDVTVQAEWGRLKGT